MAARPRTVVVGAGVAGLATARALTRAVFLVLPIGGGRAYCYADSASNSGAVAGPEDAQARRRDRMRSLPGRLREGVLRRFGARIVHANYARLLAEP